MSHTADERPQHIGTDGAKEICPRKVKNSIDPSLLVQHELAKKDDVIMPLELMQDIIYTVRPLSIRGVPKRAKMLLWRQLARPLVHSLPHDTIRATRSFCVHSKSRSTLSSTDLPMLLKILSSLSSPAFAPALPLPLLHQRHCLLIYFSFFFFFFFSQFFFTADNPRKRTVQRRIETLRFCIIIIIIIFQPASK